MFSDEIKHRARELGFDLVGIARAERSARADYLRQWLDAGQHGTMLWLEKRFDERTDPSVYLPGARSVICVAMNYHTALQEPPPDDRAFHGKIARYALGDDYHELMKNKLHLLADWMRQQWPDIQTRVAVDTAPLMEKDLAERAGIGWIGKNSCLINEKIGSWILLGELVTTLELPFDDPAIDRCGTCRRCIDACPTNAITEAYKLDARRCISYLTIEQRSEIPEPLATQSGDWLYGCDICQEVCPHNRKAPQAIEPAFAPRFPTGTVDVRDVVGWSAESYQQKLRRSAIKRVKLPILQANAARIKMRKEPRTK